MAVHHDDNEDLFFPIMSAIEAAAPRAHLQANAQNARPGIDRTPGKQHQLTAQPLSQGTQTSPASLWGATPGGRLRHEPVPGSNGRALPTLLQKIFGGFRA